MSFFSKPPSVTVSVAPYKQITVQTVDGKTVDHFDVLQVFRDAIQYSLVHIDDVITYIPIPQVAKITVHPRR